jgi:AAA+ superfamily predicted ATPase
LFDGLPVTESFLAKPKLVEFDEGMTDGKNDSTARIVRVVDDEVICAPTVYGFVLREKVFGYFPVENLSPINWDSSAFDKVVMRKETKQLIRRIIEGFFKQSAPSSINIISKRGNGMVIILHGEPGTGKTLTVEAVSEVLRRPLFSIAVSDLGVDASAVEPRLRTYLEIASIWGCIVLIDEADIFLGRRSVYNIFSNALVGAFLKVLERHRSPIFLTTNDLGSFDESMRSRICLEVRFRRLGRFEREAVWKRFLDLNKVVYNRGDTRSLSSYKLDGRNCPSLCLS